MWISRAHFNLIQQAAKDFRAWHEQERDRWAERVSDRDVAVAALTRRVEALEDERSELLRKLFAREEARSKPPDAAPDPTDTSWERIMQQQAEEMEKPNA